MSTPPTTTKDVQLELSGPELAALQRFATSHGMTLDQAATHAAQQQLQARFMPHKRFNNIARFPR
jgi:hypothetical protein